MNTRLNQKITASAVAVFVIAAILAVNILAGIIASKTEFTIDLTQDKVLEFSPLTEEVIKNLKDDVNIISIIPESFNDSYGVMTSLRMILKKYDTESDKIKYSVVDTAKNPAFTQKYKLSDGSAITSNYYLFVENASAYRVVDLNDMVSMSDKYTFLNAEQKITSAIESLTSGKTTKIYYTDNHGEQMSLYNSGAFGIGDYMPQICPDEYFSYEGLNLLNNPVPEDASAVLVIAPQADFSDEEIANLDAYLKKGGSMMFLPDSSIGVSAFEKLSSYFSERGIQYKNGVAADANSDNYFSQNPYYVIANQADFAKENKLVSSGARVASPLSLSIDITNSNYAKPLLTTSDKGFVTDAATGETAETGAQNIAVISEIGDNGKVMFFGTKDILSAYYMDGSGFANKDFMKNSIKYLAQNGGVISIGPKDLSPVYLDIPASQVKIIIVLTVIVLPLLILAAGFLVWRKRRSL
ncbi:MAG: Gldg family protein [Clostridia bacterium]|nr:Gldg family protein [Clostridia bacterium]